MDRCIHLLLRLHAHIASHFEFLSLSARWISLSNFILCAWEGNRGRGGREKEYRCFVFVSMLRVYKCASKIIDYLCAELCNRSVFCASYNGIPLYIIMNERVSLFIESPEKGNMSCSINFSGDL